MPPGCFAAVFVNVDQLWDSHGVLTASKQSAFYRIKGLSVHEIGIKIEQGSPPSLGMVSTSLHLVAHISHRLLQHLEGFVASFVQHEMVPIGVFNQWIQAIQSKLANDPDYLQ